jgi:hypothetical protein
MIVSAPELHSGAFCFCIAGFVFLARIGTGDGSTRMQTIAASALAEGCTIGGGVLSLR